VDIVATASPADALRLREDSERTRILLFGGQPPAFASDLAARGLIVTVTDVETAEALVPGSRVFIKIDAGLGRLGIPLAEAESVWERIADRLHVEGIYTHLPFHDAAGERWAREALAEFRTLVAELERSGRSAPVVQALSSPGIAAGLPLSGNAVCPGRLLYGFAPRVGAARDWGLEPVLQRIRTEVVHVRRYAAPARVGPGGKRPVDAGQVTAVIPFGRSQGNLADLAGKPVVIHRGRRVPVVGISLEHATLEIGPHRCAVGDEVVVLGDGDDARIELDEISRWSHLEPLDALVALDRGMAL
jgi:alanine racemase